MTTERWRRMEDLLHAALEREPHDRARFLAHACAGDEVLERELGELLASHEQAGSLLERPALDVAARALANARGTRDFIAVGTRVGPYEVVESIGVGGMGEVYRAVDTNLKRYVALKVLPAAVARDPQRLARFQREAEVLAALNDPHIAAIYGLESTESIRALVMELVEGPTLADRIAQGPMAIDEALAIARQIADALQAAHDRGVIHRDLKPANVKVLADGTVKVLDFGLAKALDAPSTQSGRSQSPTLTTPAMTAPGLILGTPAYMSPEQASGAQVDQRSDIWAFGCVLYEMLTGKPAFHGDSIARVLAGVLERPPDFAALPPATPSSVRRVLRRCLEKNPNKRLHHIADVRLDIQDDAVDDVIVANRVNPQTHSSLWAVMGAIAGAVGLTVLWFVSQSRPPATRSVIRSVVVTLSAAEKSGFGGEAISPDGEQFVYAVDGGLRLRRLNDIEPQFLRGSDGGIQPGFSPDGVSVAFFVPTESVIKRLFLRGGPASTVTRTDGGPPRGLSWAKDDTIVFATATSAGLWRVRAAGGTPEQLTKVVGGEAIEHAWPSVLPNGRGVLFEAFRGASSRIGIVSLTGQREISYPVATGRAPHYVNTGHLVYIDSGELVGARFDPSQLVVTSADRVSLGDAVQIGATGAASFDVAANGSLLYVPATVSVARTLAWVSRDGRETPLDLPPRSYGTVRVSPDGSRIATDIRERGSPPSIWVTDVRRPGWTRVASSGQNAGDWFPKWTPDGRRLIFAGFGSGAPSLFWTAVDGTAAVERLLTIDDSSFIDARGWSRDGQSLLFTYGTPVDPHIGVLSMATDENAKRRWTRFIERPGGALAGPIAPDGEWIVTESPDARSSWNLYVERYPRLGDRQRITTETGGRNAVWSPDGRELFYRRASDEAMMAVSIQTKPALAIGTPHVLFERRDYMPVIDSRGWDVAPDGRFLMIKQASRTTGNDTSSVVLVQNWTEELTQRAATR